MMSRHRIRDAPECVRMARVAADDVGPATGHATGRAVGGNAGCNALASVISYFSGAR